MTVGLNALAAAMGELLKEQAGIASNISSTQDAGYKRIVSGFSGVQSGQMANSTHSQFSQLIPVTSLESEHKRDFSQGSLRLTGSIYDFALVGEGFFQVQDPTLGTVLTRAGQFQLNGARQLTDHFSRAVIGSNGPINLTPEDGEIYVDTDGNIFQGDKKLGRFAVVNLPSHKLSALQSVLGGFVVDPAENIAPIPLDKFQVVQRSYEQSNVSTMNAMTALIQNSRQHETLQKAMQALSERESKSNQVLGGV